MPLSSVSCTVLPGTGSRTCSTRAQWVSPVGRSLTLDTDARPSRALSSSLRVSSTPERPEPSTPTTWAARPPRGYERRGSVCGSIARASTSGPSTGSFVILVHIEGSRRRAANTNCALPPMRCSIVAGRHVRVLRERLRERPAIGYTRRPHAHGDRAVGDRENLAGAVDDRPARRPQRHGHALLGLGGLRERSAVEQLHLHRPGTEHADGDADARQHQADAAIRAPRPRRGGRAAALSGQASPSAASRPAAARGRP